MAVLIIYTKNGNKRSFNGVRATLEVVTPTLIAIKAITIIAEPKI